MSKEFRFALGSANGLRSRVWKAWISRNDIYICSRGMMSDYKMSIHESGQCQISQTNEYIKRNNLENATRHLVKFTHQWDAVKLVLSIAFTPYDLFCSDIPNEKLNKINWLPIPQRNECLEVFCYVSPPNESCPYSLNENNPYNYLWSAQCSDGRWLVITYDSLEFSQHNKGVYLAGKSEVYEKMDIEGKLINDDNMLYILSFDEDKGFVRLIETNPFTEYKA